MATFAQWLMAQEDQVDGGGEATELARLARAWKADPDRGNTSSPSGVRRHIQSRWPDQGDDLRPPRLEAMRWLDDAHATYRQSRRLQPAETAQPAASSDLEDLVRQLGRDIGWLKAAITLLLPDEALEVLAAAEAEAAEAEAEPLDWAAMWASADHSGEAG